MSSYYVCNKTHILMNRPPFRLDSAMQARRSSPLEIGRRLPSASSYSTRNVWCSNFGNLFLTSLCRSVMSAKRGSVNLIK
ncbi:hypothetical protein Hanom_Chr17g01532371 [Helianthus anomalus]